MRIFYSIIHNGRKPFDDVNLRKALSYAFDYDYSSTISCLAQSPETLFQCQITYGATQRMLKVILTT